MNIGIPRALIYYNYYPFFYGFFKSLGIEIILSDKTTKQIMSQGSALVVSETCLPVKVYVGHVINLLNKNVDAIFIPSIQSIAHKIYNCSKIRALPDLIRNVVKQPINIIETTFDKSEKDNDLTSFLTDTAAALGIKDESKIKKAKDFAWQVFNNFQVMTSSGVKFDIALKNAINGKIVIPNTSKEYEINVAVLAHGYNLYDDRVSMKIFDKLEKLNVKTYTYEQLSKSQLEEGILSLNSNIYWANEYEMTGAAGHYLQNDKIDGIITLTAFSCGPDSMMIERIVRNSKKYNKPILNLTLDEHTGEAGFVTRLEAFIDMLIRKKRVKLKSKVNKKNEKLELATKKRANFENIEII